MSQWLQLASVLVVALVLLLIGVGLVEADTRRRHRVESRACRESDERREEAIRALAAAGILDRIPDRLKLELARHGHHDHSGP
jgi:flagellar biosynthesis/type III secretory pathway M-ring protein FliF/YscJ